MNAPITTTPAGDLLANIHELEWLDVGGGTQFKKPPDLRKNRPVGTVCAHGVWGSISGASP